MDNAGLIDHGSAGVVCNISEILQVGSISRGPSSFSSASSSPPPGPTATSNPSGGNAAPATAGPVGTTMVSASPPDEDVSKLDVAIMAYSISLLVPVALNFKDLTSSWDSPWKVLYGVLMISSFASTVIGFFTAAWCPAVSWGRWLSPSCARFGLVDASALFVVFLVCKIGHLGYVAGVASAAFIVLVLAVARAWSEQRPATTGGADQATPAV